MKLGIDFGTTRTVVAAVDRGNVPLISFQWPDGEVRPWYPTVVAERRGSLRFGLDALAAEREGWALHRSFKRALSQSGLLPSAVFTGGQASVPLVELLTGFFRSLREDLLRHSNLPRADAAEPLEAVVAAPANAHSLQRFLTLEGFRRAGFDVRLVLNEPSAAGLEYACRHARTLSRRREEVLIYDLGGGTFDASLVHLQSEAYEVKASLGLSDLGGDDFDQVLAELALAAEGLEPARLDWTSQQRLLQHAREIKESLHPNTKRAVVELGACLEPALLQAAGLEEDHATVLATAAYYGAVRPLVDRTVALVERVMALGGEATEDRLAGVYIVGGASALCSFPSTRACASPASTLGWCPSGASPTPGPRSKKSTRSCPRASSS